MRLIVFGDVHANIVALERCYEEIESVMQATLDELAAERPYPILSRLRSLIPWR